MIEAKRLTNYKGAFVGTFSEYPEYLAKKTITNFTDLNLGEGLRIFTSVHLSDSGLFNLLNGFDFYFRWCDSENQQ